MPPSPAGESSPEKQALLDAFNDVLRADADRRAEDAVAPPPPRARLISPVLATGLLTLLALVVSIAVTRPPWLGFAEDYVEAPVVQDASLRLAIYQARQRVEQYRRVHGALPATLTIAGVNDPALRMTVVSGAQYVIEGGSDSARLALRSDEPVRPFLGDAFEVVVDGRTR